MRRAVIILLVATLGACGHSRADRTAAAGDTAAPVEKAGKDRSLDLPGGLGGDKAHRAYTGDAAPKLTEVGPK